MDSGPVLTTARLTLRPWCQSDLVPFAQLNADPRVMEHFPQLLSGDESDALAARIRQHFADQGFGLWAAELPGESPFIGFVGLAIPAYETPFTPCVEIGWRLAAEFWGRGLATEGAQAALEYAWNPLGLDEVVSFTVPANRRSQRVMQRLGMVRDLDGDFDHPRLPEGHALRRHVLYRLRRPQ